MDRYFDEELKNLKEKLIIMSSMVEDMIGKAITALKERHEEYIQQVFEQEKKVNMLQIEIDDIAMKLIALHQPAASDLRFIISAIKINADLERAGDLAINIVEITAELIKEPPLKILIDIPRMADISQKMLKDAIDAFINRNSTVAIDVCRRDDTVDDLNDRLFRELLTYMIADSANINRAIGLMLVARNLERIADHATNIGEDVYYIVEGKDIRHHINDNSY